jgi:sporulation protein YtfJ
MSQHPIEGLMDTAMRSIKEMVDVNTIIGDTIQTGDGTYIIPVSRVSFGFASGGGEFTKNGQEKQNTSHNAQTGNNEELPFAGGSAAGVSISPVAFMTVTNGTVKLLSVNTNASVDKLLDLIPDLFKKKDTKENKETKDRFEKTDKQKTGPSAEQKTTENTLS